MRERKYGKRLRAKIFFSALNSVIRNHLDSRGRTIYRVKTKQRVGIIVTHQGVID
ncbi:MAG: hypothetical protein QXJ24_06245 [Thermoplasmatales archaeon]